MIDQLAAFPGADAGNLVEKGLGAFFAAPLAMGGDGETMRLITDVLQQMQGRRFGFQYQFLTAAAKKQGLLPCLAADTLGDADQLHALDIQFRKHDLGLGELTLAAVDQQNIGQPRFALLQADIAAFQRLFHGGVIISGRNVLDIETPVIAFQGAVLIEDHTGGHRGFSGTVTDIETFQTGRQLFTVQGFLQRAETVLHALFAVEFA